MNIDKYGKCLEMFDHACAFLEGAALLWQKYNQDFEECLIYFYDTPAVVNFAFSCEVFLKLLLKHYDIQLKRIHKLKELYDLLPTNPKEWIKGNVQNAYGGKWKNLFGIEHLEGISNAFADWRYSYEHDWSESSVMYIEMGFLIAFCNTLREACCQLLFRTTWEEYKGSKNG